MPGKCTWSHRDAVTYSKRFPLCRNEKATGVNQWLRYVWWPVLTSGFGVMSISEARGTVTLSKRISLRIHHNEKSTA